MKKIILASESKQFTRAAMEFLSQIHKQESLFVVGGFSHSLNHARLSEISSQPNMGLAVELVEQDREALDENILLFEYYCERQRIKCRIHEEKYAFEIDELVSESRFADILVMNAKLLGNGVDAAESKLHIKQVLHKAECPVLLIPDTYTAFKRIAIAYDGKKESMFALKQFCYLFPEFLNLPTEIVFLSKNEETDVPRLKVLKEYVNQNFSSINICKVNIDPKKDLAGWASDRKDVLVIAGSYGRAGAFNSVADSFIDPILDIHQLPVFITHR